MLKILLIVAPLLLMLTSCNKAKLTEPFPAKINSNLVYFGYSLIDVGWDDPKDSEEKTNYLYGDLNHFFEHSSELVTHFDCGLKGQKIEFIGFLYRGFIGYRFQPVDKRIILRVGVGWKEVVQLGIGFRF